MPLLWLRHPLLCHWSMYLASCDCTTHHHHPYSARFVTINCHQISTRPAVLHQPVALAVVLPIHCQICSCFSTNPPPYLHHPASSPPELLCLATNICCVSPLAAVQTHYHSTNSHHLVQLSLLDFPRCSFTVARVQNVTQIDSTV